MGNKPTLVSSAVYLTGNKEMGVTIMGSSHGDQSPEFCLCAFMHIAKNHSPLVFIMLG